MNSSAYSDAANDPLNPHLRELRGLSNWAIAVVVVGLVPIAAWMTFAPLSSAVVAQAYVKVDLNRRPVQHAEGGIVREVLVRDGQHVHQGQPLLVIARTLGFRIRRWERPTATPGLRCGIGDVVRPCRRTRRSKRSPFREPVRTNRALSSSRCSSIR